MADNFASVSSQRCSQAAGSAGSLIFKGKRIARHIPALDALRAVAVCLVLVYHLGISGPMGYFANGAVGVEIFFVLSGFLITHLLIRENAARGSISFRRFYARRFLRIGPAFYAYWTVAVAAYIIRGHPVATGPAVSSLLYVHNYYAAFVHPPESYFSHTWSLAIEEQFYLLWPATFFVCRANLRRLAWCLGTFIAGVWSYRAMLQCAHVSQAYIYSAFDTRMDQLAIGCLLAIVVNQGAFAGVWNRLCRSRLAPAISLAMLFGSGVLDMYFPGGYRNVVGFALEPALAAVIIVQLIYFSDVWPWKFTRWRWIGYLGSISYSLYLYHELAIVAGRRFLAGYGEPAQYAAALLVTFTAATLSYHLVEQPFLKLKERLSRPGRAKPMLMVHPVLAEVSNNN